MCNLYILVEQFNSNAWCTYKVVGKHTEELKVCLTKTSGTAKTNVTVTIDIATFISSTCDLHARFLIQFREML